MQLSKYLRSIRNSFDKISFCHQDIMRNINICETEFFMKKKHEKKIFIVIQINRYNDEVH